jgi:hypothetical protein
MALRREKHGDLQAAIVGDLHTVDLPEASFDVVYSAFVLEHVRDPELVMRKYGPYIGFQFLVAFCLERTKADTGFSRRHDA